MLRNKVYIKYLVAIWHAMAAGSFHIASLLSDGQSCHLAELFISKTKLCPLYYHIRLTTTSPCTPLWRHRAFFSFIFLFITRGTIRRQPTMSGKPVPFRILFPWPTFPVIFMNTLVKCRKERLIWNQSVLLSTSVDAIPRCLILKMMQSLVWGDK